MCIHAVTPAALAGGEIDTLRSAVQTKVHPEEPGSPPPNVALKIAARFPEKEAACLSSCRDGEKEGQR
jgi:hypothetical protein